MNEVSFREKIVALQQEWLKDLKKSLLINPLKNLIFLTATLRCKV